MDRSREYTVAWKAGDSDRGCIFWPRQPSGMVASEAQLFSARMRWFPMVVSGNQPPSDLILVKKTYFIQFFPIAIVRAASQGSGSLA